LEVYLINSDNNIITHIISNQFIRISASHTPYYVVIYLISPYNIQERILEYDIIVDKQIDKDNKENDSNKDKDNYINNESHQQSLPNFSIEKIDNINSYEFIDKYVPDKHGTILKELVYSPDNVCASFSIKLVKGFPKSDKFDKTDKTMTDKDKLKRPTSSYDKDLRKNSNLSQGGNINIQDLDIEEIPLDESTSIKIIVEIFNPDGTLIYSETGFNKVIVKNILLKGYPYIPAEQENKKRNIHNTNTNIGTHSAELPKPAQIPEPFLLVFRFEQDDLPLPDFLKVDYIYWSIKVYSTDTLGFVKDTRKEDEENSIKNGWEQKEQGRSLKAQVSRSKALLLLKKQKGEKLNEKDERLLNEPREVKLTPKEIIEDHDDKFSDKHDKNRTKKVDRKKPEESKKITTTIFGSTIDKKIIDAIPKEIDHTAKYIKKYVGYCGDNRLKYLDTSLTDTQFISK